MVMKKERNILEKHTFSADSLHFSTRCANHHFSNFGEINILHQIHTFWMNFKNIKTSSLLRECVGRNRMSEEVNEGKEQTAFGLGNSILRSIRPGRRSASSRISIRLVAMRTLMFWVGSKPSSWLRSSSMVRWTSALITWQIQYEKLSWEDQTRIRVTTAVDTCPTNGINFIHEDDRGSMLTCHNKKFTDHTCTFSDIFLNKFGSKKRRNSYANRTGSGMSNPETRIKVHFVWCATALARSVLPVPGGP